MVNYPTILGLSQEDIDRQLYVGVLGLESRVKALENKPKPTPTGTVTVTLLNTDSEEAKGVIYLCDSNEAPYEDDSNVIAYGQTTRNTNPVTLTLYDVETHEPTEVTDIPFDTYYVFAKDNGDEEFYTGTLTVDGDETVTITLTGE